MTKIEFYVGIFYTVLIFSSVSVAGIVSDDLAAKISNAPHEKIPIVITIKDTSSVPTLKKELNATYKTFFDRHRHGIEKLKASAGSSQISLIKSLKVLESSGLAHNLKSHWLINVITADIDAAKSKKSRRDLISLPYSKYLKSNLSSLPLKIWRLDSRWQELNRI